MWPDIPMSDTVAEHRNLQPKNSSQLCTWSRDHAYAVRDRDALPRRGRNRWGSKLWRARETARALMAEAAGDPGVRPGMVVVPQTFGSSVNVHPHVHAIVSRGGWTRDGAWVPIPYVDSGAAARLFRHKVLRLLLAAGRIDVERVELILGWRVRERLLGSQRGRGAAR